MIVNQGYDYDDVLVMPKESYGWRPSSRNEVTVATNYFTKNKPTLPIFSAPMRGISEAKNIVLMSKVGIVGILNRIGRTREERFYDIKFLLKSNVEHFGVAVGIREYDEELNFAVHLVNDLGVKLICVDVANGYSPNLLDFVYALKHSCKTDVKIMSGNVISFEGALDLYKAGCDFVRVGIGSGTACLTRDNIGVGSPQLTALYDCSKVKSMAKGLQIVSDGGIINASRAVKSFAVGADWLMLGSYLARATEFNLDKVYGMASREVQAESGGIRSVEGLSYEVSNKLPLLELVDNLIRNLQSACTYLGVSNYKDIKDNSVFISTGTNTLKG